MFMRSGYSAHTRRVESGLAGALSATKHHHGAADVLLGRGHRARAGIVQSRFASLAMQAGCTQAVELDDIALTRGCRSLSARVRRDGALALDADGAPAHPHAQRTTLVERRSNVGTLRGWPVTLELGVEWLELGHARTGHRGGADGVAGRARPDPRGRGPGARPAGGPAPPAPPPPAPGRAAGQL